MAAHSVPALVGRGAALTELARHDEALAALELVLERDAFEPRALTSRARLAWREGRVSDALADLHRIADADDAPALARAVRAEIHLSLGQVGAAIDDLERASAGRVVPAFVHSLHAEALVASGQPEPALRVASQGIERDPLAPDAWLLRAVAAASLGDRVAADHDLDACLAAFARHVAPASRASSFADVLALAALGREGEAVARLGDRADSAPAELVGRARRWLALIARTAPVGRDSHLVDARLSDAERTDAPVPN